MSPTQQMAAMTKVIVADSLAAVRQRAEDDRTASRVHEVCADAVEAMRECRVRWSDTPDGELQPCGLPSGHEGRHVLLADQDGPLLSI